MVFFFQLFCRLENFQNKKLSKKESSLDPYLPASYYVQLIQLHGWVCHPAQPNFYSLMYQSSFGLLLAGFCPTTALNLVSLTIVLTASILAGVRMPHRWLLSCLQKPQTQPQPAAKTSQFFFLGAPALFSLKPSLRVLINSYGFKNWVCSSDVQIRASSVDLAHADHSTIPLLHVPSGIFHRHLKFNFYSFFH